MTAGIGARLAKIERQKRKKIRAALLEIVESTSRQHPGFCHPEASRRVVEIWERRGRPTILGREDLFQLCREASLREEGKP